MGARVAYPMASAAWWRFYEEIGRILGPSGRPWQPRRRHPRD
jgi:hypothetical protein